MQESYHSDLRPFDVDQSNRQKQQHGYRLNCGAEYFLSFL